MKNKNILTILPKFSVTKEILDKDRKQYKNILKVETFNFTNMATRKKKVQKKIQEKLFTKEEVDLIVKKEVENALHKFLDSPKDEVKSEQMTVAMTSTEILETKLIKLEEALKNHISIRSILVADLIDDTASVIISANNRIENIHKSK